MIVRGAKDYGIKLGLDVLGYKCFRFDLALRSYPFIEWVGAIEGKEMGSILLHPGCAAKLAKELEAEALDSRSDA